MKHDNERNDSEWNNDNNWTLPIGIYFSKIDSRWIVPKRVKMMGWTFNLGNSIGVTAMLLLMIAPILLFIGVIAVVINR